MKDKPKKCYNCKHAGEQFKLKGTVLDKMTYLHCQHPKWKPEDMASGKISPWDTLQEFWQTCSDYELADALITELNKES